MSLVLSAPSIGVSELVPAGDDQSVMGLMEAAVWYLHNARTLQEARELKARAVAINAYVQEQAFGEEVRLRSRAVTYIAARKVGEFLHHSKRARGGRPRKTGSNLVPQKTLRELGLDKKESALAQHLFALPADLFEKLCDEKDMTLAKAQYIARLRVERKALIDVDIEVPPYVWDLRASSCADLFASGIRPSAVITRPPTDDASLPLFTELALGCQLAQVPFVAVAINVRRLPQILDRLGAHLKYQTLWTSDVPTLVFATEEGETRRLSRGPAKNHPGWIRHAVEQLTVPGELVCDPFVECNRFRNPDVAITALHEERQFVGAVHEPLTLNEAQEEIEGELVAQHRVRCVRTVMRRTRLDKLEKYA